MKLYFEAVLEGGKRDLADQLLRRKDSSKVVEYGQTGRVKLTTRERNGHISAASNSALALATGEFIVLVDHDDLIPDYTLFVVAAGERVGGGGVSSITMTSRSLPSLSNS